MRPSWDNYFLQLAAIAATRATCDRAHVGCVLVKDKHVLTTGYNGAARALDDCTLVGCLMIDGHCRRTLHAEQNAIIQAALHGVSTAGATAYLTHQPCLTCTLMLINAGIVHVVYSGEYNDENSIKFFNAAGIMPERIEL
jgi:dCMP deaminase